MQKVDQGNVKEVNINGMEVRGKYTDGASFPHHGAGRIIRICIKSLQAKNVTVTFHDINGGNWHAGC